MVICNRGRAFQALRAASAVLMTATSLVAAGCGGVGQGAATTSDVPPASQGSGTPGSRTSANGHALTGLSSWSLMTSDALGRQPLEKEIGDTATPLVVLDAESVEAVHKPLQKGLSQLRGASGKRFVVTMDVSHISPASSLWKREWQPAETGVLPSSAPAWLIAAGAKSSTLRTKFWDPAWQKLIGTLAASYADAGFDGIALTGVDAYTASQSDRSTAAVDMANLVTGLTRALREKKPEMSIVVLDAPLLADRLSETDRTAYWNSVDGIVAQSVFYSKAKDTGTPEKPATVELNPNVDLIASLDKADRAGKTVLDWEAVADKQQSADFEARARSRGYVPFVPIGQRAASASSAATATDAAKTAPDQNKPAPADTRRPADPAVI